MKIKHLLLFIFFLLQLQISSAQDSDNYTWWNPANNEFYVVEGQGWPGKVESTYDRLPKEMKKEVREPLWDLSKQSAGLLIRFRSDAREIKVRYKVKGEYAMSHMPATGVSGVDLYAKNSDGELLWSRGQYSFNDTIQYHFKNLDPKDKYHDLGREYQLFLPLYNSIEWLEIGVPKNTRLDPLPIRKEKPIVVYGTSIAQGACASRPGMAWTSILSRKMGRPLINLAFSGNGRLENEMIDIIGTIDAKVYVLDCLPNLTLNKNRASEEVYQRIITSVKEIRENNQRAPILLVDHAGYSDGSTNKDRYKTYIELNELQAKAFDELRSEGIENIYLLTKEELHLGLEDFVDGTHPSDLGMMKYALAYEKKIRMILNEPVGEEATTIPITQSREPQNYNWEQRHQELLTLNKNDPPRICFIGNSITHYWGGSPTATIVNGDKSWNKYLEPLQIRNFGFGWDRIENVLWRVYHDELDGYNADQILLNIGTNNLHLNTNREIIDGLEQLIRAIKYRQPKAKMLILGLYPRRKNEEKVVELNLMISQLASQYKINYMDVGMVLLNKNGKIDESLFSDGLHPNNKGYNKIAPMIKSYLQNEN
jgi:lysophospholipase L1-like esterase